METANAVNTLPKAETPKQIQNGFALVNFVRATLERDKRDNPFILYDLSFALTDEHKEWVPRRVATAWEALLSVDLSNCEVRGVPPVDVVLSIAPDAGDKVKDTRLCLEGSALEKVKLALVEERGRGKKKTFVRLSARIRVGCTNDTIAFARNHFGRTVWLAWDQTQKEMFAKPN